MVIFVTQIVIRTREEEKEKNVEEDKDGDDDGSLPLWPWAWRPPARPFKLVTAQPVQKILVLNT